MTKLNKQDVDKLFNKKKARYESVCLGLYNPLNEGYAFLEKNEFKQLRKNTKFKFFSISKNTEGDKRGFYEGFWIYDLNFLNYPIKNFEEMPDDELIKNVELYLLVKTKIYLNKRISGREVSIYAPKWELPLPSPDPLSAGGYLLLSFGGLISPEEERKKIGSYTKYEYGVSSFDYYRLFKNKGDKIKRDLNYELEFLKHSDSILRYSNSFLSYLFGNCVTFAPYFDEGGFDEKQSLKNKLSLERSIKDLETKLVKNIRKKLMVNCCNRNY